jgi:antitoxin ParD1/3/4
MLPAMAMTSLNISMPQSLKVYVEDQVSTRGYSSPSEYLRELLRPEEIPAKSSAPQQSATAKLEALLLEGLNSGNPIEITPDYWERKRTLLIERHNKKSATPEGSKWVSDT